MRGLDVLGNLEERIDSWTGRKLDARQRDLFRAVTRDALGGLVLGHGPAGTGKTTTLASIILTMTPMQQQVLAVSNSNLGIDNLMLSLERIRTEMDETDFSGLSQRLLMIRRHTPSLESELLAGTRAGHLLHRAHAPSEAETDPILEGLDTEVVTATDRAVYSQTSLRCPHMALATLVAEWLETNPHHPLASRCRSLRTSTMTTDGGGKGTWRRMMRIEKEIQCRLMNYCHIIGATTHVAAAGLGSKAKVVVLEESSQIQLFYLVCILLANPRIRLVLCFGVPSS